MKFKTEQEEFWAGNFGNDYVERNKSARVLSSKLAFWSEVVKHMGGGYILAWSWDVTSD